MAPCSTISRIVGPSERKAISRRGKTFKPFGNEQGAVVHIKRKANHLPHGRRDDDKR